MIIEFWACFIPEFTEFQSVASVFQTLGKFQLTGKIQKCTFGALFSFFDLVWCAQIAQLAEHVLGKDEVVGSSPILGSSTFQSVNSLHPTT